MITGFYRIWVYGIVDCNHNPQTRQIVSPLSKPCLESNIEDKNRTLQKLRNILRLDNSLI